jgi:hypothetical protein
VNIEGWYLSRAAVEGMAPNMVSYKTNVKCGICTEGLEKLKTYPVGIVGPPDKI